MTQNSFPNGSATTAHSIDGSTSGKNPGSRIELPPSATTSATARNIVDGQIDVRPVLQLRFLLRNELEQDRSMFFLAEAGKLALPVSES